MYHIHTTLGLILDSKNYGEAGKILRIFTRNYGLVSTVAQGIRLERSKLRYFAQNHSVANFSLVKGKEFWRLTSASSVLDKKIIDNIGNKKNIQILMVRMCKMLARLLQGEERHEELFDMVWEGIEFMHKQEYIDEERMKILESIIMYKILKLLGYIGVDNELDKSLYNLPIDTSLLDENMKNRNIINQHVNKALVESHL
jgi:DNA repair protein RecO (recombination protein O)